MGYAIRPVQTAAELAAVFDVMGAQFEPARTRAHRSFTELAALFPERRALMLLAEDDGRIVGGAHVGPRGTLAIALVPEPAAAGKAARGLKVFPWRIPNPATRWRGANCAPRTTTGTRWSNCSGCPRETGG